MLDFARGYEERAKGFVIFPRANTPKARKLLLYGAPKCGKTSLALDLVRHYKRPILLDCADLRVRMDLAQSELLKLFLEKRFDALIIDNYSPELSIPSHPDVIIIAPNPAKLGESIRADFTAHCVRPLNFEEYVSFSKSNKLESIFASFLKEGNLPELPYTPESKRTARIQEIFTLYARHNTSILAFLLRYQGKPFSTHNAFCLLKQQQKISKDKIYALIDSLQSEQVIITLPHAKQKESKKLYFYDFALPYAISPAPNFQAIFENMIFCELLHAGIAPDVDSGMSYDESCDFIIGDLGIFALPFPTPALIESKLSRLTRSFAQVLFISIDTTLPPAPYTNHGHLGARGSYRVMSFIDFALESIHTIYSIAKGAASPKK